MSNKETEKIMLFEKNKNGLRVSPLSEMSNDACLLSTVEQNKGKLLEQRKLEIAQCDCSSVVCQRLQTCHSVKSD